MASKKLFAAGNVQVSMPEHNIDISCPCRATSTWMNIIESTTFNNIKEPLPFRSISSKLYYGLEQFRQTHLDFFNITSAGNLTQPVFMFRYSYGRHGKRSLYEKWSLESSYSKKGIYLNVVHTLDRPFNEMMIGLQSWCLS